MGQQFGLAQLGSSWILSEFPPVYTPVCIKALLMAVGWGTLVRFHEFLIQQQTNPFMAAEQNSEKAPGAEAQNGSVPPASFCGPEQVIRSAQNEEQGQTPFLGKRTELHCRGYACR